jgi:hypothetical protein
VQHKPAARRHRSSPDIAAASATGTTSAAVRRGGRRRRSERPRERGLDGVADVVAPGCHARSKQRRGCRRFVARQGVEHATVTAHRAPDHVAARKTANLPRRIGPQITLIRRGIGPK